MSEPARRTPGELLQERGQLADDVIAVQADDQAVGVVTSADADARPRLFRHSDPLPPSGAPALGRSRYRGHGADKNPTTLSEELERGRK
jgi:hypothetical protein